MNTLLWCCAIGGALLLVVGIFADGIFDGLLDVLSLGDDGVVVPAFGAFVSAFGIGGLVASSLTDRRGAVLLAGAVTGVVVGFVAARLARAVAHMPSDATPSSSHLTGRTGKVVTPVRPEGAGEVIVTIGGQPMKLTARSHQDLPTGTTVVVVEVLSPSSVRVESESSFFGSQVEGYER